MPEAFGGPPGLAANGINLAEATLYGGRGCENCGGTGYKGRVALHELLVTDDPTRQAISRKAPVEEVRRLAVASGMTTLLQDGVAKALAGLTDLKAVLAVASR
jgi:type IV pilus assembly protein PilB